MDSGAIAALQGRRGEPTPPPQAIADRVEPAKYGLRRAPAASRMVRDVPHSRRRN
jgi:hypothetical protein